MPEPKEIIGVQGHLPYHIIIAFVGGVLAAATAFAASVASASVAIASVAIVTVHGSNLMLLVSLFDSVLESFRKGFETGSG